jgi:hypothetical protein
MAKPNGLLKPLLANTDPMPSGVNFWIVSLLEFVA